MDGSSPAFQKLAAVRPAAPSKAASLEAAADSASSARGKLQKDNWKLSQELAAVRKQLQRERDQLESVEERHRGEVRGLRARIRVLSSSTGIALQAVAAAAVQQGFAEDAAQSWLQAARNGLQQDVAGAGAGKEAKHLASLLSSLPWSGEITPISKGSRAFVAQAEEGGETADQVKLERDALAGFARQYQAQLQAATASLQQHQQQLLAEKRHNKELQQALEASKEALRDRARGREEASSPWKREESGGAAVQAAAAVTEARVQELVKFLKKREKELEQERDKREEMARCHAREMEKKQQKILELRSSVHEMAMNEQAERVRLELWGDFGAQLARAVKSLKQNAELDLERLDARTLELERGLLARNQLARDAVLRSERLTAELAVAQHRNEALLAANSSHEARFGALEDQTQQQLAITKKLLLAETETRLALERRCRMLSDQLEDSRQDAQGLSQSFISSRQGGQEFGLPATSDEEELLGGENSEQIRNSENTVSGDGVEEKGMLLSEEGCERDLHEDAEADSNGSERGVEESLEDLVQKEITEEDGEEEDGEYCLESENSE